MTRLRCLSNLAWSSKWSPWVSDSRPCPMRRPCSSATQPDNATLIRQHTQPTRHHMTSEIVLRLITKECPLWCAQGSKSPFADPFWAFYWPGGQVLARYILDNRALFRGQSVLDVGSGCGASAIAAAMARASHVVANDIDPVAIAAIQLNAAENGVPLKTSSANMIGQYDYKPTTILIGDMFYDEAFRDNLVDWLKQCVRRFQTNVFIGDPGRLPLVNHPIKSSLTKCAAYELPESCMEENNGLSTGFVWKLEDT